MSGNDRTLAWPEGLIAPAEFARQWDRVEPAFLALLGRHRLNGDGAPDLARVYLPLAAWLLARRRDGPLLVGINGAQGSGKSTLCDFLRLIFEQCHGRRVAVLSIDDIYLTRAERQALAQEVHPLLITRGVPGTHDIELGLATLDRLRSAGATDHTPLPVFDKARDDRRPAEDWPVFRGRPDIILFEGWCVGTPPQPEAALGEPVNALERDEDADGRWRRHVNDRLGETYARLFAGLDTLVFLRVPGMGSVLEWRGLQERRLAATAPDGRHLMGPEAIRRFVMHYERLTRHALETLPARADLTLILDPGHRFAGLRFKARVRREGA